MAIITGMVERVSMNANGICSFNVDGVRYGTFKDKPPCNEGDTITFTATQDKTGQYWNANAKTIRKADGAPPPTTPPPIAGAPQAARTPYVPQVDRNASIVYQSSRKDALQFLDLLLSKDLIDLGTAKLKNPDKVSIMEDMLDMYTERFVQDVENLGHKSAEPKQTNAVKQADSEMMDDDIPF